MSLVETPKKKVSKRKSQREGGLRSKNTQTTIGIAEFAGVNSNWPGVLL
jgi:hypothetical protein